MLLHTNFDLVPALIGGRTLTETCCGALDYPDVPGARFVEVAYLRLGPGVHLLATHLARLLVHRLVEVLRSKSSWRDKLPRLE